MKNDFVINIPRDNFYYCSILISNLIKQKFVIYSMENSYNKEE